MTDERIPELTRRVTKGERMTNNTKLKPGQVRVISFEEARIAELEGRLQTAKEVAQQQMCTIERLLSMVERLIAEKHNKEER